MITVSYAPAAVESDLRCGLLSCPECAGALRPWGHARERRIRMGTAGPSVSVFCPLRARCTGCRMTHVLLPVVLAARKADEALVIAAAIEAKALEGLGHRSIADRVGRPVSTVRGWLRSFGSSAASLCSWFRSLLLRDASDAASLWPQSARGILAQALGVLLAYARVVGERFAVPEASAVPWHAAALASAGPWVFSGTWWVKRLATPIGPDRAGC
nr:DUF6431 domain-containing protein [Paeniglutamicibacter sulfureus]